MNTPGDVAAESNPAHTLTVPVVAPTGTVAVILVSELMVNVASTPLNINRVAPVKPAPVITTCVPTGPRSGLNEVITNGITVKSEAVCQERPGAVTVTGPTGRPMER